LNRKRIRGGGELGPEGSSKGTSKRGVGITVGVSLLLKGWNEIEAIFSQNPHGRKPSTEKGKKKAPKPKRQDVDETPKTTGNSL